MKLKSLGIFGLFVFLLLFLSIMTSDPWYEVWNGSFWKANNVQNLLHRTSLYGLLGVGVAFVIITGGIDLSIGSIVCLAGCLLAVFLRVDYRALDRTVVVQIKADTGSILLRTSSSKLAAGDTIRLSEVRRAKNAVVTIEKVEVVELENAAGKSVGKATRLKVGGGLSKDDDTGVIAKAFRIKEFRDRVDGGTAKLVLEGDVQPLRPRDQLVLVHPTKGQKQLEIEAVEFGNGQTEIVTNRELGNDFSTEWFGVPLARTQRMSIPAALLSVLGIAALLGVIHGLLITRVGLQPFIVTLCGLLIYRGLSRYFVNDEAVGFGKEYTDGLSRLGGGNWTLFQWEAGGHTDSFGIPYPLFIFLAVAILASIFLNMTIWGRYLLALGRNEEAARFSGIDTKRYTLLAYVICTVAAAISGMLFALNFGSVSPSSFGNFFELYAIAAAVLGGCSLRGGEGTIVGVVLGTAVMQMLNNMILLMQISNELEFVIIGFVILLGVVADEVFRQLAARRRPNTSTA